MEFLQLKTITVQICIMLPTALDSSTSEAEKGVA